MSASGFAYRRRVHYHECDLEGIIYNSHLYAYFDEALKELARERPGLAPAVPDVGADGLRAVVSEARLRFLSPIRLGDEIEIAIEVGDAGEHGVLWNLTATLNGSTVAEGAIETRLEDDERTPRVLPAGVRSELASLAPRGP